MSVIDVINHERKSEVVIDFKLNYILHLGIDWFDELVGVVGGQRNHIVTHVLI